MPLFDRLLKKIQCQVRSQLEWDMSENISELKEKRSPASGVENEPLLPSDRNKLGKGKSSLLHCEGVLWAE